jgi:hypothetical protein
MRGAGASDAVSRYSKAWCDERPNILKPRILACLSSRRAVATALVNAKHGGDASASFAHQLRCQLSMKGRPKYKYIEALYTSSYLIFDIFCISFSPPNRPTQLSPISIFTSFHPMSLFLSTSTLLFVFFYSIHVYPRSIMFSLLFSLFSNKCD